MKAEDFFKIILSLSPFFLLKIFFLVGLAFYTVFSLVVFRQVSLMVNVVEAQISPLLKTLAALHLALSFLILILLLLLL